jgi:Protein of unknown function (DUF3619)
MNTDNTNQKETHVENTEIDAQGKQIAGLLNNHANRLSMRSLKQLENGRERAVKAHERQVSGATVNRDGTLSGMFSWADHHRVMTISLLLGAMIAGFVMMQSLNRNSEASDAFLLGADLPPEAFVDRGFEPYLNNAQAKL